MCSKRSREAAYVRCFYCVLIYPEVLGRHRDTALAVRSSLINNGTKNGSACWCRLKDRKSECDTFNEKSDEPRSQQKS